MLKNLMKADPNNIQGGDIMITALIFDFDGTIIDTETAWYYAYKDIYNQYGVELTVELWGQCIGTTFANFNPHSYLEESTGQSLDWNEIMTLAGRKHEGYMENQSLRPGVLNYLETAKARGIKLAIASSSRRSWIEAYLESFDIRHYFEFIVTADDVEQVKPSPELYMKALDKLNESADHALAFEDSRNGLVAAKKAGLACVIVPNEVTSHMNFDNYDLRINSLQDLSLEELLQQIQKK